MNQIAKTIAITICVICALSTIWAWERQTNAVKRDTIRLELIDRTDRQEGPEAAILAGTRTTPNNPEAWQTATLVLGTISVAAGASAMISHRYSKRKVNE